MAYVQPICGPYIACVYIPQNLKTTVAEIRMVLVFCNNLHITFHDFGEIRHEAGFPYWRLYKEKARFNATSWSLWKTRFVDNRIGDWWLSIVEKNPSEPWIGEKYWIKIMWRLVRFITFLYWRPMLGRICRGQPESGVEIARFGPKYAQSRGRWYFYYDSVHHNQKLTTTTKRGLIQAPFRWYDFRHWGNDIWAIPMDLHGFGMGFGPSNWPLT